MTDVNVLLTCLLYIDPRRGLQANNVINVKVPCSEKILKRCWYCYESQENTFSLIMLENRTVTITEVFFYADKTSPCILLT